MAEDKATDRKRNQRRSYSSPNLVDYGAVTKLTQGASGIHGDGAGGLMLLP